MLPRSAPRDDGLGVHPRTLYGRRKGKALRAHQSHLLRDLLPQVSLPAAGLIDPGALFPLVSETRLEIGFGGGEHLAREAAASPDAGFLGCEPFINGVAKLLARIESGPLPNIRMHAGDARDLLERLKPGSLDRIDLLYPDPWPKRRQRKRRFVSQATIALMARALRPGGEWRFATDIDDYAGWTLAHVLRSDGFRWSAESCADWREPWPGWQPTRYEEKARRDGRDSAYLTFVRV